jgi:hemoglobin-like flavoprotein
MPQRQIELIRASYDQITPISSAVGEIFYNRLFELAPELRSMFDGSFAGPGGKFRVISQVVERHVRALVSQPVTPMGEKPPILPPMMELGYKHAGFPLTIEHFDKMKEALLWTLEETLGDNFPHETRECWSTAYDGVADMIRRAMETARQQQSADELAKGSGEL